MAASREFTYKARDRNGQTFFGRRVGDSEASVRAWLRDSGARPLKVTAVGEGLLARLGFGQRVKAQDVAIFARQMSVMSETGYGMTRGLALLADSSDSEPLRKALRVVKDDVEGGLQLADAFAKWPKAFPPLMVHMTRAANKGASLHETMEQIADATEAEDQLRSDIKSAMSSPLVILGMAALLALGMVFFIVPIFEKMFAELGGELPTPTKVLVAISQGMTTGLPLIVLAAGAAVWAWRKYRNQPRVRGYVDSMKLSLPVVGALFNKVAIARFARGLASLKRSGMPILEALDTVADASGNVVVAGAVRRVRAGVKVGGEMTPVMRTEPIFPTMVTALVAFGEENEKTELMLDKVADFYQRDVQRTAATLTSLIAPIMTVAVGSIIGAMVIAMYMPMFSVYDQIR
jgi:type IV pilus assembly protein PilC